MRLANFSRNIRRAGGALVAVGLLVVLPGCTLDDDNPPALIGPSETGVSAQLSALPDVVNADGVSESVIELVLRDQNGSPASGRAVEFVLASGDGTLRPSASSTFVGPLQFNSFVMATSETGTAVVVYQAGSAATTVTVAVRPYSFDAGRAFYTFVEILQQ